MFGITANQAKKTAGRVLSILFGVSVILLAGLTAGARADVSVTLSGPAGLRSESISGDSGVFAVNMPLTKNAQNKITIQAKDQHGNTAEKEVSITQVSFENLVVAEVKAEQLSIERVEQLVNEGVIKLDNPANFNVSQFDIVLTIADKPVVVSVPIATPKIEIEPVGYETYQVPQGYGDGGGGRQNLPPIEIIVFEKVIASAPGEPAPPPIPGVIIIEGRIKSLKEFFSVRLMLMNTSGIFTLADVNASLEYPDGGLSNILPADGLAALGQILPGTPSQPGQKEKEFIVRGDELGTKRIKVNFGGNVTGAGIPENNPIAFNGSATTSVEVKGPPKFQVQVNHPSTVTRNIPYELLVDIANIGETPALYTSLELDVGVDAQLVNCTTDPATGIPSCLAADGSITRSFGHILSGQKVRESFTVMPLVSGDISSCLGVSDQNITLQVTAGDKGCLAGKYPPPLGSSDGKPAVSVLPTPNMFGVSPQSPVTAFFSEEMDTGTITTGPAGSFKVLDSLSNVVPGILRFELINGKTAAVWQVNDGVINRLAPNTEYTVQLSQSILDIQGAALSNAWISKFTTSGESIADFTPPVVTLSVEPPVNPNAVLPGQLVQVNTYASDQGSGVARIELRSKDLSIPGNLFKLIDQKKVNEVELPPFTFAVDSAQLIFGHTYQLQATAYDQMGNTQNATLALVILQNSAAPAITLPADDSQGILSGIGISITPEEITGGVTTVRYYLDTGTSPFQTVTLAPYSASLSTIDLPLGQHTIKAIAEDGLGQTGQDSYHFTLQENTTAPTVAFSLPAAGTAVLTGATIPVSAEITDPTGIKSIKYYLDSTAGTPLVSNLKTFVLNTNGIPTGSHTIYCLATNNLNLTNLQSAPGSSISFSIIDPPPAPPPPAPQLTDVSFPQDGQVTVSGSTVPGVRVDITNATLGITVTTYAGAGGTFSLAIDGETGDQISVIVYDSSQQNHSDPAVQTIGAAPTLESIEISSEPPIFTAFNQYRDLTVIAHYSGGGTVNVTAGSTFVSSDLAVASASSSGRVVPVANGSTSIQAIYQGKLTQIPVTVNVVVLTGLSILPSPIQFAAVDQTAQLSVTAHYSDGSSVTPANGVSYTSGNPGIASVSGNGLVRAIGNGTTQITASIPGVPPVSTEVFVVLANDTPPAVQILAPVNNYPVERNELVEISVKGTDQVGGISEIRLAANGAYTHSEIRLVGGLLNTTQLFTIAVPADAAVGGTIDLSLTAVDTSGNLSPPAVISLLVVDLTAPSVSISSPAQQTPYNFGDTVDISATANDSVGVTQIRYQTTGALSLSGVRNFTPAVGSQSADFSFTVPYGATSPDLRIHVWAKDEAGNEREAQPVDVVLTQADITPPQTIATSTSAPGSGSTTVVNYQVTAGIGDLDYVVLYFRRNGIGTFNRYTDSAGGNPLGRFDPQNGSSGTITFNSERMGGDGTYEFYTSGFDIAGNRETDPRDGSNSIVPDLAAIAFNTGTEVTVISTPTVIGEGDFSYDNRNLRIVGTTVTLSGHHDFHNIDLQSGATLTHPETNLGSEYSLDLSAWSISIDSTSSIEVSARGYLGGLSNGNGCTGQTLSGLEGSGQYAGGSYGGLGGQGGGAPGPLYGLLTDPLESGSGGGCGSYSRVGGDGGGRIYLSAINLAVDGAVNSNGANGSGFSSGSGAGGSIRFAVNTLSGNGGVQANGGGAEIGGGGGRVAVFFVDISTFDQGKLQALGGDGTVAEGGNGTVFLKGFSEANGTLVIDGQGTATSFSSLPIPPGYVFDGIVLRNSAKVVADTPLMVNGELRLENNSTITHTHGLEAGLSIQARSIFVDATSSIDVSGKGYRGGLQYGQQCLGETLGGIALVPGSSGGSYGGLGNSDGGEPNPAYGQPAEPIYLGSGGGCGSYSRVGGMGGGRISITASEQIEINGTISADGGATSDFNAGGGSGGSIRIETSLFKGTGAIHANGSALNNSGGGGRIAVHYDYIAADGYNLNGLRNVVARGGRGNNSSGSAGTVLFKRSDQSFGDLYIDEDLAAGTSPRWTALTHLGFGTVQSIDSNTIMLDGRVPILPDGLVGMEINPNMSQGTTFRIIANSADTITVVPLGGANLAAAASAGDTYSGIYRFDNVYLRRGGWLVLGDKLIVSEQLKVAESGILTHYDATTSFDSRMDITAHRIEVADGSEISATDRGLPGGLRHGSGCTGITVSGLTGAAQFSGGSYGGLGSGSAPNPIYGSLTNPSQLGSGGGCGSYSRAGGDGGGWIKITASEMLVDGIVSANGGPAGDYNAAGGSGGTINLELGTLEGAGKIQSNGSGVNHSGGGGRIAVRYAASTFAPEQFEVLGGRGYTELGGNGTLYLKSGSQIYGDLIIDGHSLAAISDKTPIPANLVFDNVILRNSAVVISDSPLSITGALRLENSSTLSHSRGNLNGLQIAADTVFVDASSSIDVSARGYRGGLRDGAPCEGETLGGGFAVLQFTGGSYGGLGGVGSSNPESLAYGQASEPAYLGSGGGCGSYSRTGGNGGGKIDIAAGTKVEILGAVLANGQDGIGYSSASGSGGSVRIETEQFKGSGRITANGGSAEVGGGGGRIAVYFGTLGGSGEDFSGLRNITAAGGHSGAAGSAGTVFYKRPSQSFGDLYIDEGLSSGLYQRWTPLTRIGFGKIKALTADTLQTYGNISYLPGGLVGLKIKPDINQDIEFTVIANTADTITVAPSGPIGLTDVAAVDNTFAAAYRYDSIILRGGGFLVVGDLLTAAGSVILSEQSILTHFDTTLTEESRLDLTAGTIEIAVGSSIDVNGRGYLGGLSNGNSCAGQTLPGLTGASQFASGSYAGNGVTSGGQTNALYGTAANPEELGSGGGCGSYSRAGGDGGGRIKIRAAELLVNGTIDSIGLPGAGYYAGGGSGGSINIDAGTLNGTGAIRAEGAGLPTLLAGGGGRVAIRYDSFNFGTTGTVSANGGFGGNGIAAENGSVFLQPK